MKIACVATSQVPSTTANSIQVMKVCHGLAQNGHQVDLLVPRSHKAIEASARQADLLASIEKPGFTWEDLAAHYGLTDRFTTRWLSSWDRGKRYDFALSAVWQSRMRGAKVLYTWAPQAALFARLSGLPVILEMHDRPTGRLGPFVFRLFLRLPGKKRVLMITQALRSVLEHDFCCSFKPGEAQIAPNAIDPEQYAALPQPSQARQALGLPERPTIVYTGSFYEGRGVAALLGMALVYPQANFLWVGGQPGDVARLKVRIKQANIENVILTGFVANRRLPLYQAAADVLLMPYERAIAGSSGGNSAEICSPMKMFDYMATGRAILASDLPVFHEVLNEQNAVFCPPEDITAWQTALGALLGDPAKMQRLGEQARADSMRYTWKNRAEKALENFL